MRVGLLVGKRLVTAMLAAATLAACSGGDDNGTEPTPTINIVATPTTATVSQGGNTTVNVALTRSGGFTGDVTLAVESPTGSLITGTPAPATLGSSVTSSVITLAAGAAAPTGVVNVTIRATGTGVTAKTAQVALTVNASATPTYSLAATAATVAAGGTGTSNITITRTGGFTGNVTLAATGLPTGVTAAFNPNNTGTNASVLTFTAAANAVAGTSTVTVTGTATGQADKTTTLQLTVTPAGGGASYSLAATAATVAAGATGTSNVTITRTGGFAGNVTLAATGLPTGVTAAFNPNNTGTNASVLTFTAAANATAGTSTVTVTGTADGQADKTTTLQLTVTAAAGNFTLALNPTTLSVAQGATGNTTVTITRTNGFAGAVNLTATGLPNGVTAAFNPAGPTTNTSTLTLTASATATVGQATVTVRGNATGLAEQTATLALTVTQSVGGSGNTTWEFCTAGQTPLWLAIQDGASGTWTRVTPTGTKFQFNITQARGGVAFVTGESDAISASADRTLAQKLSSIMQQELRIRNRLTRGRFNASMSSALVDGFALSIFYGTQQELNASGTSQCLPGTGKTVNGTVAGLGQTQSALISLGPVNTSATAASTSFQLTDVPDGALDLLATRLDINLSTLSFAADKLILRRAQNFTNNATIPVLDFGAAEAFDPVQPNLTVNNLNGEFAAVATMFFTGAGNSTSGAPLFIGLPTAAPFKYYAVPQSRLINGDLHLVFAGATASQTSTDNMRTAGVFFKDPTDRTVTLGPALTAPTVNAAATTPYARLRATGPIQASYNKTVLVTYAQSTASVYRSVSITASEGYLSGMTSYDLAIPDFSAVAGWDNNWGPKAGVQTFWQVSATGFTGVGFGTNAPLEGSTFTSGTRSGTFTP